MEQAPCRDPTALGSVLYAHDITQVPVHPNPHHREAVRTTLGIGSVAHPLLSSAPSSIVRWIGHVEYGSSVGDDQGQRGGEKGPTESSRAKEA